VPRHEQVARRGRERERLRERLGEREGENETNKDSYRKKLPPLLSPTENHAWHLAAITLISPALPFLLVTRGGEIGALFMAELASILHLGCLC